MHNWASRNTFATAAFVALLVAAGNPVAPVRAESFVTFDVFGSHNNFPESINRTGAVTGYYINNANEDHFPRGFVLYADGLPYTTFAPPGAFDVYPTAINDKNVIAGWWHDFGFEAHGFIRTAEGELLAFDPADSTHTEVADINNKGVAAGWYADALQERHGFVRKSDGAITTFDSPSGYTSITVMALNEPGSTVGRVKSTARSAFDGFVRSPDGTISTFVVPGAHDTRPTDINKLGEIAGDYDLEDGSWHSFFRAVDGTITTFDGSARAVMTHVTGINNNGEIVGYFTKKITHYHSFVRTRAGKMKIVSYADQYTNSFAKGINDSGDVTGRWNYGPDGTNYGYVRRK